MIVKLAEIWGFVNPIHPKPSSKSPLAPLFQEGYLLLQPPLIKGDLEGLVRPPATCY
jgi:hypothetical protein